MTASFFYPANAVSEFFENLMNNFCKAMYDGLYSLDRKSVV